MVGCDFQRAALRGLFCPTRSVLALLVRPCAVDLGDLVLGKEFEAAMATKFAARLRGRTRFLCRHFQLARVTRHFVRKRLVARFVPTAGIISGPKF